MFDLTELATDSEDEESDDGGGEESDEDSNKEEIPLDLSGMLADGTLAPPSGVETKVDQFFLSNFEGKSYEAFHQGYRRKVALKKTTKTFKRNKEEYKQAVDRHIAWEAAIADAHFSA